MGVAKSDFSQMRRSRSDLIKNAERFAGIDLDQSRLKKCNHWLFIIKNPIDLDLSDEMVPVR